MLMFYLSLLEGDNNKALFTAFYTRYRARLYAVALNILKDPALAEDAAQETLLRAWRRYGTFRGEAAERTWITAIALNMCRDLLRSPWHTRRMELSALAEPAAEDAPWDDTPLRAVLSLPRKYREVVLLRYYEEFTLEEIADTLGIAPGTVSARLTRAKRRLRPMLEEWYYD